mgnify:CR=1 FL=1
MVKRAAKQMLRETSESFNESFEHNKKILANSMPSIPVRNKIAGYIARLKRMQKNPRHIKEKVVEAEEEFTPRRQRTTYT